MNSSKSNGMGYAALLAGLLAAALLASCGGGQQVQAFRPSRVISFGDETSVIRADGSKYTVNALASGSTTVIDCGANPIWVQSVAAAYGFVFPECAGTSAVDLDSIMEAHVRPIVRTAADAAVRVIPAERYQWMVLAALVLLLAALWIGARQ